MFCAFIGQVPANIAATVTPLFPNAKPFTVVAKDEPKPAA